MIALVKEMDIELVKWAILLITISLSIMDFYIRRIPNVINLIAFGIFLVVAVLMEERTAFTVAKDVGLVTVVSYMLYYLNVLGGGDCKYIIAISPIISVNVLFKIVVLAMIIFVIAYIVVKMVQSIYEKSFHWPKKLELHKMPFIWSLVPGFYLFALKF